MGGGEDCSLALITSSGLDPLVTEMEGEEVDLTEARLRASLDSLPSSMSSVVRSRESSFVELSALFMPWKLLFIMFDDLLLEPSWLL